MNIYIFANYERKSIWPKLENHRSITNRTRPRKMPLKMNKTSNYVQYLFLKK